MGFLDTVKKVAAIAGIIAGVALVAYGLYKLLSSSKKDADKSFSDCPVGGTTESCPKEEKIKIAELVEFISHDGKEHTEKPAARKQYINLDEKVDPKTPHYEYGRKIRLKARVEWAAGDKTRPLTGKKVYWYAKPDGSNRAGLAGDAKEGFDSAGSGNLRTEVSVDDKGWTPAVDFHLSRYGGDKFEIFATEDSGYMGGLKAGAYTVWRKMYYEIAEMKKPSGGKFEIPAGTISKIVSSYKKVFVEMESAGTKDLGDHQDNFSTHEDGYKWADKYCGKEGVPWKVHYSIIDHLCPDDRKEEKEATISCTAVTQVPDDPYFRPFDFGGAKWLKEAKYKDASGKMVDFPAGKVTREKSSGKTKLKIDFTGTGVTPSAAKPVEVRVKYYNAPGFNGWGGTNLHLVICRGSMDEGYSAGEIERAMAGTGIHEPGHALGLVYGSLSWKSTTPGQENHCEKKDCVMWFQGYIGRPLDFHDESAGDPGCRTYLREKDMSRTAMEPKWKFPRS